VLHQTIFAKMKMHLIVEKCETKGMNCNQIYNIKRENSMEEQSLRGEYLIILK
jgi:hypothetical protein